MDQDEERQIEVETIVEVEVRRRVERYRPPTHFLFSVAISVVTLFVVWVSGKRDGWLIWFACCLGFLLLLMLAMFWRDFSSDASRKEELSESYVPSIILSATSVLMLIYALFA